jgi:hypothetical protein
MINTATRLIRDDFTIEFGGSRYQLPPEVRTEAIKGAHVGIGWDRMFMGKIYVAVNNKIFEARRANTVTTSGRISAQL